MINIIVYIKLFAACNIFLVVLVWILVCTSHVAYRYVLLSGTLVLLSDIKANW